MLSVTLAVSVLTLLMLVVISLSKSADKPPGAFELRSQMR